MFQPVVPCSKSPLTTRSIWEGTADGVSVGPAVGVDVAGSLVADGEGAAVASLDVSGVETAVADAVGAIDDGEAASGTTVVASVAVGEAAAAATIGVGVTV